MYFPDLAKKFRPKYEFCCLYGFFVYHIPSCISGSLLSFMHRCVGSVAQPVQRLTTEWTVRESNPGGASFSACPDRHWGPPSLLYNGYRVFPGGKVRSGRAADHSTSSSAAVMEEQSYTCNHPLGHSKACNGDSLPLPLFVYVWLYVLYASI